MAALTAATRNRLPRKEFALPGNRFPIEDKKHARLAIGGATRAEKVGNITPVQEAMIKAQARRKLAK